MKFATIIGTALAVSLLSSTPVLADNWHSRDYKWDRKHHKKMEKAERKMEKAERKAEQRAHQRWVRGNSWPSEYRHSRYIVNDWRDRELRRPPSGYRWYRADREYVLVRQDNNLIEDIIDALD